MVDAGRARTFLCDIYAARKLGRPSTGSAGGASAAARRHHLELHPAAGHDAGRASCEKLDRGLYVTELMGFGFNAVTGDFSRGAGGFWIENGELAFPVSEVTISANFDELLKRIDAVGDDLDTRSSVAVPDLPRGAR